MKVKIFTTDTMNDVEKEVNDFMVDKKVKVIDIKITNFSEYRISVLVMYEEKYV